MKRSKFIIIFTLLTLNMSLAFAKDQFEQNCQSDQTCENLEQNDSNFYNADISENQAEGAFALADEMMGNIGRSIAGEFEAE